MLGEASPSRRVARLWPLVSSIGALLLVAMLAAVVFYREHNKPFGFELEWMGELVEHRSGFVTSVAMVFNTIGGGVVAQLLIPLGVALALLLWRRGWAALYFLLATVLAAGAVQAVKHLLGRARPIDILVAADSGSFPSGHSANAAVIAATLGIVFARTWVWAAGVIYTIAMMLSRTYLGAHWISDTVGGALLGAGIAVIVWAPFAAKLYGERRARHSPIWMRAGGRRLPSDYL